MPRSIRADGSFWFFLALLILTLPLNWVLSALLAAAVHELCHLLMLRFLGVFVYSLRIRPGGAMLDTGPVGPKEELLSALAGPLGSFFLLAFIRTAPRIALCALVQGLFNLIPLGNRDGGRIVKSAFRLLREKALANRGK